MLIILCRQFKIAVIISIVFLLHPVASVTAQAQTAKVATGKLPSSAGRELRMPFSNMALSMEYRGIALSDPKYYYWCISPIEDENGKIHLFTCRWSVPNYYSWDEYMRGKPGWESPKGYMGGWKNICEVAHFIGDSPEGPWTYVDTPISNDMINNINGVPANRGQVAPHNVRIKKIDGKYRIKPTYFYAAVPLNISGYNATQSIVMKIHEAPFDPQFPDNH